MIFGNRKKETDSMRVYSAAVADAGMVRKVNEDSCITYSIKYNEEVVNVILLADGMGGYDSGDVASGYFLDISQKIINDSLESSEVIPVGDIINTCFSRVNKELVDLSKSKKKKMGTTGVCVLFEKETAHIAWIGDSRVYRNRGNVLMQLSRDHSLVVRLVEAGIITDEEAKLHPRRNEITRALGIDMDTGNADYISEPLKRGDIFLVCSDGLTGELSDEQIRDIIIENNAKINKMSKKVSSGSSNSDLLKENISSLCHRLIDAANESGGRDNISVALALIL